MDNGVCRAVSQTSEGEITRKELCKNEVKNTCCYLCTNQEACEISCNYLITSEGVPSSQENINGEISKCRKAIENMSVYLAEGKIGEESYLRSVKALESKIADLSTTQKKPCVHHTSPKSAMPLEEDFVEKPSGLWYLVPFFFGIIGGIVAYVGTKDRDKSMAINLLVFGIVWSFILFLFALVAFASLFSRLY